MNLLEVADSSFLQKNAAMKEDITQDVQAIHTYSHDLWHYASGVTQTVLHFAHTNLCMVSSVLKESITSNSDGRAGTTYLIECVCRKQCIG